MKKWVSVVLVFLLILLILIYSFTPSQLTVIVNKPISSNVNAVQKTLQKTGLWNSWFPGQFRVTKKLSNGVAIDVLMHDKITAGQIISIPIREDSSEVSWKTSLPDPHGPFERVSGYWSARKLKESMSNALDRFASFCANDSNVYGIPVTQTSTKDTFLVATKFFSRQYPSTPEIYSYIDKLRKYIIENNLSETGSPMLNATNADSTGYRCMVAVPINTITTGKNEVFFVRMVPGRFLTAGVKGGPATIRIAQEAMTQYFVDYKRTSMAIPFEYLVTDRLAEKDTSNWITKLYYPVY